MLAKGLALTGSTLHLCAPCIADHQLMKTVFETFGKAGIEIIGVSTDYDRDKWANFIHKKHRQ